MSAPNTPPPTPTSPDWERIEADYRAGILSLREIAELNPGTNHVAITRKAKREGWTRDLAGKIKAKADELVTRNAVTPAVTIRDSVSERKIIEANAEAIVQVRLSHRQDIRRGRAVVVSLLDELELTCGPANAALLEELGEVMRKEDQNGQDKRNDLYNKLMSMPGRVKAMKDLGDALKNLIGLEREAYSLDDPKAVAEQGIGATPFMTDAERAVRLTRLINGSPEALAALASTIGNKA